MKQAVRSRLPQAKPLWLTAKQPATEARLENAQKQAQEACADALRWVADAVRLMPLAEHVTNADDVALLVREAELRLAMQLSLICTVSRCRDVAEETGRRFVEAVTPRAERILESRVAAFQAERDERTFTVEIVGS